MDFLGISAWIFDFLVLQMLPLFSVVLLVIGIIKVADYLPDTIKRYAENAGKRLRKGMR